MPVVRFNPDYPDTEQTLTLEGRQYILRTYWMERMGAYYVDISDVQGNPIVTGERLTPGCSLAFGALDAPPGVFLGYGPDPYERKDLGVTLGLFYLPSEFNNG